MEDNKEEEYNKEEECNKEILETCCICYNNALILFLNCNHIICLECITNIKKLCCPLCRAELSYLPKKIINIINSNNSINTGTNNYLSLIHNVIPLSLSSANNLTSTINQNLTPLSILNPNLSSLSSIMPNSPVNNSLLSYEQYFNELAFIDVDDIIHYGFISSMNENNTDAEEHFNDNSDNEGVYYNNGMNSSDSNSDSDSDSNHDNNSNR